MKKELERIYTHEQLRKMWEETYKEIYEQSEISGEVIITKTPK